MERASAFANVLIFIITISSISGIRAASSYRQQNDANGADGMGRNGNGNYEEVGTMSAAEDRLVPVRILLDSNGNGNGDGNGKKTTRNLTLVCLAPREERPIDYRDTTIVYRRVLDDGSQEETLGENTYPSLGNATAVLADGRDIGTSWSIFNVQQNDSGKYYCDLQKRRRTVVATVGFQVVVVEPAKSVRLVSTATAKVTAHYIQVKDKVPYHLKCEVDGGKPYLKTELVIDGGTRREARNYSDEERGVTIIEETGIMLHADLVKVSCVAIVSETDDFDRADSTVLKRITKDEKLLQVHYPPHVVECIAESQNETVSSEFQKVKSESDHFLLLLVGRPDAVVCFVRADPDLDEVYWVVGPQNDTMRHGERHNALNMRASVSRRHESKMHKNVSVYEARLHFGEAIRHTAGSAFTLKAHSKVANATAVLKLQERTSAIDERYQGVPFTSAASSLTIPGSISFSRLLLSLGLGLGSTLVLSSFVSVPSFFFS